MNQINRDSKGYWDTQRANLEQDAKTLNFTQLFKKYATSSVKMRALLRKFGISPLSQKIDWASHLPELKKLAKTKTAHELAEHYGTNAVTMHGTLHRYGIKAFIYPRPPRFVGGLEALKQLASTMTEAELADHFAISVMTVRKHLKNLSVVCKRGEGRSAWEPRKEEIKGLIEEGLNYVQIAAFYECTAGAMRNAMQRLGLKTKVKQMGGRKAEPKPKPAPKPKRAAATPFVLRHTRPPQTIAQITAEQKKKPFTVIMPADAKITISHFNPPAGSRICNGASRETYNPATHGGATRSYR